MEDLRSEKPEVIFKADDETTMGLKFIPARENTQQFMEQFDGYATISAALGIYSADGEADSAPFLYAATVIWRKNFEDLHPIRIRCEIYCPMMEHIKKRLKKANINMIPGGLIVRMLAARETEVRSGPAAQDRPTTFELP